jgi:hypothetical protein
VSRHRIEDVLQELGGRSPPPAPLAIVEFVSAWRERKAEQDAHRRSEYDRAFADGLAEGQRLAQAEREAQAQQVAARAAEEMAAARRSWSIEEGQSLGKAVTQQVARIEDAAATLIADILGPILQARAHRAGLDELIGAVRSLVALKGAASVVIKGRQDLLEVVGSCLSAEGIAHELVPSDTSEILVTIDETTITANLRSLLPRLEETLS